MCKIAKTIAICMCGVLICASLCSCSGNHDASVIADTLYGKVVSISDQTLAIEVGTIGSSGRMGGFGDMNNNGMPPEMTTGSDMSTPPMSSDSVGKSASDNDGKGADGKSDVAFEEQDNQESGFGGMNGHGDLIPASVFTSCGIRLTINVSDELRVATESGETLLPIEIETGAVIAIEMEDNKAAAITVLNTVTEFSEENMSGRLNSDAAYDDKMSKSDRVSP